MLASGKMGKYILKEKIHHYTRKKYPFKCDIKNCREMKKRMKAHSYIHANYKCLECEFVCETKLTMEVHFGKKSSESFEYGIYNFVGENLEKLELHLFKYEIYSCAECEIECKRLNKMKKHGNDIQPILKTCYKAYQT